MDGDIKQITVICPKCRWDVTLDRCFPDDEGNYGDMLWQEYDMECKECGFKFHIRTATIVESE